MSLDLRIGYIPLCDAALLFVAAEYGFDRDCGLCFKLMRETSWANLRDKLAIGFYDGAHMLAPAAIAGTLELSGVRAPMVAPLALGLDGNAISVSGDLSAALRDICGDNIHDPAHSARALREIIRRRKAQHMPPLRFAHVFPFSSHYYQWLMWLELGGVDPADLRFTVIPPPHMGEAIQAAYIDGFCVGEPWNALAQNAGAAHILFPCRALVRDCPEKVLAFHADYAVRHPDVLRAAAEAVRGAAVWAADPQNADALVQLIADRLALTSALREDAIRAKILLRPILLDSSILRLDLAATRLDRAQALWLYARMVMAGQLDDSAANAARAANVFRDSLVPVI